MEKRFHSNEFKVMIVELKQSGMSTKQISTDYELNPSMISRWCREYKLKRGNLSNPKALSTESLELRALRREL